MLSNFDIWLGKDTRIHDLLIYLSKLGYRLSYVKDNVWNIFKIDPDRLLHEFYGRYSWHKADGKQKYIIDALALQEINNMLCATQMADDYILTKGNNKLLALAAHGMTHADLLIVSRISMGTSITHMDQLYALLNKLMPKAKSFYIELDANMEVPALHHIEDADKSLVWYCNNLQDTHLMSSCLLGSNCVVLFGQLIAADHLNYIKDRRTVKDHEHFLRLVEDYPSWCQHFIWSEQACVISSGYVDFCQCNILERKSVRHGITKAGDLHLYNRCNEKGQDMIIPRPPRIDWSGRRDLNPRPPVPQTGALPG